MGLKGFVEGGIASIVAGCSTHPLDLIKVRMQLQGENNVPNPNHNIHSLRPAFAFNSTAVSAPSNLHIPVPPPPPKVGLISVGVKIFQTEGVAALYSGVSATILRQTLYSTTRMGLYEVFKQKWTDPNSGTLPIGRKIAAGLLAGGIGAAVGNPADVAMVRMQADGRLPASERRNYKSVVDAITRMARQEGVTSLWRGSSLTVNRAMIVTASQLASYDQVKETILEKGLMKDGLAKMHLDLQRLLQVIAHGEQVFPRVKERCASKHWFANEDIISLEELIGRLRRLKENVGFIANRITAVQAGLDSWQAEQINKKLYYLSFLSIIFLPLSVITGVFGMNVGGVPWTGQRDPKIKDGFRNVILLCVVMLFFLLLCFIVPAVYARIVAWRRKRALKRSWSLNRKSFLKRTVGGEGRGGYLRL